MSIDRVDGCLRLPDGRNLSFAEYGAPAGMPVFYCHGFPGSRLEARLGAAQAAALNIRLIAPDRPGFGASDDHESRVLTDWPADLRALADHLDIDCFHLVGVSGGGPYALACAATMPERLLGVALVCALGEMADGDQVKDMNNVLGVGVRLYQAAPDMSAWLYRHLMSPLLGGHPEQVFDLLLGNAPLADQQVLADPDVRGALVASFRESFAQGGNGPAHELRIYTASWPFAVTRIQVPVTLWHGELDPTVPVSMGRRHASLLPRCDQHIVPSEGHFSLVVHYLREILSILTDLGSDDR